MLQHIAEHIDIFKCPACPGDLEIAGDLVRCLRCRNSYKTQDGIALLFWPDRNRRTERTKDVTDMVRSFYENTPFSNYEGTENISDLVRKARKSSFANLLDEQVPFNARVLEVGCGTGQLSNFLGISHRFVFGADICLNSLKLANGFRVRNDLHRVGFYQMNLFRPAFKEESFPLVICSGVLHHTGDPFGGFQTVSKLVKKGGYIIVGLYNRYGRIITDIRRSIFNISGGHFKFLDPRLRNVEIGDIRKAAWFMDQYKHPHESRHTVDEVLTWFEQAGFDFINSVPKLKAFGGFSEDEKLFEPNPKGDPLDHFFMQARLLFAGSAEGGFFLMIGKRRT